MYETVVINNTLSFDNPNLHHQLVMDLTRLTTTLRVISPSRCASIAALLVHNARTAIKALNCEDVSLARIQALSHPRCQHPRSHGATLFGLGSHHPVSVDWAAWANTLAVTIDSAKEQKIYENALTPALVAVAQHAGADGDELLQGIAVALISYQELSKVNQLQDSKSPDGLCAALAIACGMGRCLHLSERCVMQSLRHVLENSIWHRMNIADIAFQVIGCVDRSMRSEYPSAFKAAHTSANTFNCIGRLNDSILLDALVDDIFLFSTETQNWISSPLQESFTELIQHLPQLNYAEVMELNPKADRIQLTRCEPNARGIF
tara:strand:- start:264 stop:1223 length:960 start_codon:yes stop_codon:yes gene_type:complete